MIEETDSVKFVIVGNSNVGKTSIVQRYCTDSFVPEQRPTIGAACSDVTIKYDGVAYHINIWDTAGQETYRNLVPMYYHGASVAIIVVDATSKKSLESVEYWIDDIHENISDVIVLLCCNKIDLIENREIDIEDLQQKSLDLKIPFFETSAVSGSGIYKLFEFAFSEFIKVQKVKIIKREELKTNKSPCC